MLLAIPYTIGFCSAGLQAKNAELQEAKSQAVDLTLEQNQGKVPPVFDFGTAHFGQIVTHVFTLRNDTKAAIHIDHLQPSCGCLSVPLVNGVKQQALPTLAPGGTVQIEVQLDTIRLPFLTTTPLLSGSEIHKQVFVYVKGQPVHAAAVLEMRGRITYGVSFDPPSLDFGTVNQAKGASRLVQVRYDAVLYQEGKTRLIATGQDGVQVLPVKLPASGKVPVRLPDKSQIVRWYKILVPAHAPISLLSGTLSVQGLASPPSTAKSATASPTLPSPTCQMAYTGQVVGKVIAQPGMVVFGLVRNSDMAGGLAATQPQQTRTNRWILLTAPSETEADTPGSPAHHQEKAAKQPDKSPMFWQGARIQVDSPYFAASLLPAEKAVALAQAKNKFSRPLPPLSASLQWRSSTACWLQVRLLPDAPEGKLLTGHVLITLADGERIRLPILAQRE